MPGVTLILLHHATSPQSDRAADVVGDSWAAGQGGTHTVLSSWEVGALWGPWGGGLRNMEEEGSHRQVGWRLRGRWVPLLSVPVFQPFPAPGVRNRGRDKALDTLRRLLPTVTSHRGPPCPPTLSARSFPCTALFFTTAVLAAWNQGISFCLFTCHISPANVSLARRGSYSVLLAFVSPWGPEERLSEWELHGMAAASGHGWAIPGAWAQETWPVALPSSRLLGEPRAESLLSPGRTVMPGGARC